MWGRLSDEALTVQKSNTDDRGIFDLVRIATSDIIEVSPGVQEKSKRVASVKAQVVEVLLAQVGKHAFYFFLCFFFQVIGIFILMV